MGLKVHPTLCSRNCSYVSARSFRILSVSGKRHTEVSREIEVIIRQGMSSLQAALRKRAEDLKALLATIEAASDLNELEELEKCIPVQVAALTRHFDEVLDNLERTLEAAEEQAVQDVVEHRLSRVLEEGEDCHADEARPLPPSDLVLRLREFLAAAALSLPSSETAKQKLTLARTALGALRAQQHNGETSDALRELDSQEIEDLSTLVVDLALLVANLKGPQVGSVPVASVGNVHVSSRMAPTRKTIPRGSQSRNPAPKPQSPKNKVAITPMGPEAIARYEEDYHRLVGLVQTLKGTASTAEHRHELRDLEELLSHRREELSNWRKQGGYTGPLPLFLADTFDGALPGESHVRGVKKKSAKKKKAAAAKEGGKRSRSRSRRKKSRVQGGGIPFSVWAEDSWGKDPDDTPRDRNVVLGGAMESNRSRH